MNVVRRLFFTLGIVAAIGVATPAVARAAPNASADLGQMVAMCAQSHAGQRSNPPQVTCTCGPNCPCPCSTGTMTFENFGAMVHHMQDMACC